MKQAIASITIIVVAVAALIAIVLVIAGGILAPKKYLEPWNRNYFARFTDSRLQVLAHGILAANIHDMQPWKIRLDDKDKMSFLLFVDPDRLTPGVDPNAGETTISQGTFLEYVRIAAQKIGYRAEIALFPQEEYNSSGSAESMRDKPVARVTLQTSTPENDPLYDAMFIPDTSRVAYKEIRLTPGQLDKLQGLNTDQELSLAIYQDPGNLARLKQLALDGAMIEANVHRINVDNSKIFRANEYQKNRFRDGFSVEGQGTSGLAMYLMQGLITLVPALNNEQSAKQLFINLTQTEVNHTPIYALIISRGNSRAAQVKAGMLYSRFQLAAESMGFAVQPMSQVLGEYPEMKEQYRKIHQEYAGQNETIQMFFRVGQPVREVPHSMRRDVLDLVGS